MRGKHRRVHHLVVVLEQHLDLVDAHVAHDLVGEVHLHPHHLAEPRPHLREKCVSQALFTCSETLLHTTIISDENSLETSHSYHTSQTTPSLYADGGLTIVYNYYQ